MIQFFEITKYQFLILINHSINKEYLIFPKKIYLLTTKFCIFE